MRLQSRPSRVHPIHFLAIVFDLCFCGKRAISTHGRFRPVAECCVDRQNIEPQQQRGTGTRLDSERQIGTNL